MSSNKLEIPSSIKGITAEWLTQALHNAGILEKGISVSNQEISKVEGGFSGTLYRLKLSYSSSSKTGPDSLILKLVTARKGDSSTEKEWYFYQNTASKVAVEGLFRAPKSYLALKSDSTYIFLLEDLGELKHKEQKEGGADYETARRIVISLATFHAKFWNNSDNAFAELHEKYCPVDDQDWEKVQSSMTRSIDEFNSLLNDEELHKTGKFCAEHLAALAKKSQEPPCTLLHGDACISNYFFEGERGVVAVGWKGFTVGSGPGELAYFLSMNVQENVRKKHETEFLHLYCDILKKLGAFSKKGKEEFTFDSCYHKYILGVATSSALPILTAHSFIEGREVIQTQANKDDESTKLKIAMHDNIKPMIDLWCTTAHNHPITSLHVEQ